MVDVESIGNPICWTSQDVGKQVLLVGPRPIKVRSVYRQREYVVGKVDLR